VMALLVIVRNVATVRLLIYRNIRHTKQLTVLFTSRSRTSTDEQVADVQQ